MEILFHWTTLVLSSHLNVYPIYSMKRASVYSWCCLVIQSICSLRCMMVGVCGTKQRSFFSCLGQSPTTLFEELNVEDRCDSLHVRVGHMQNTSVQKCPLTSALRSMKRNSFSILLFMRFSRSLLGGDLADKVVYWILILLNSFPSPRSSTVWQEWNHFMICLTWQSSQAIKWKQLSANSDRFFNENTLTYRWWEAVIVGKYLYPSYVLICISPHIWVRIVLSPKFAMKLQFDGYFVFLVWRQFLQFLPCCL